jgi:hypothetical protein
MASSCNKHAHQRFSLFLRPAMVELSGSILPHQIAVIKMPEPKPTTISEVDSKDQSGRYWVSYLARCFYIFFAVVSLYVLSFGPVLRLTGGRITFNGGLGFHNTVYTSWIPWNIAVYSPLYSVLNGHGLPSDVLWWYVNLWTPGVHDLQKGEMPIEK